MIRKTFVVMWCLLVALIANHVVGGSTETQWQRLLFLAVIGGGVAINILVALTLEDFKREYNQSKESK